ncbi:integration host factor subunit alpha [Acuticoccus mangrovi]|uniref:Integration host factor subunit alpha n=1 Tax=Acuticoccus mangrovi TaxID=2796142 RepID=A0A934IPS7_9HYPH|nr:integration host factor subunit alpha [Acuticoccus mangrovi]MBJ3776495.1 integration host factor subunit alpha [Acuticoccus mangrovi]
MAGRTITRADLSNAVCRKVKVSRTEASDLIDQIIEEIVSALERGEPVRLSSFGAFEVRQKKERIGRNPKTGQEVPIESRRVVTFRPSDVLKRYINFMKANSSD